MSLRSTPNDCHWHVCYPVSDWHTLTSDNLKMKKADLLASRGRKQRESEKLWLLVCTDSEYHGLSATPPPLLHSLTLAAGLHQVISGGNKLALHYSPGARLFFAVHSCKSLQYSSWLLSRFPDPACPRRRSPPRPSGSSFACLLSRFPDPACPDYVLRLVPLVPRSPVSCPGFPTLPVPDYDPTKVCYQRYPPVFVLLLGPNHTSYTETRAVNSTGPLDIG